VLVLRYLQENRVACEMGLYYVLHIAKLRNRNALQRLLPALGEEAEPAEPSGGSRVSCDPGCPLHWSS